MPFFQAVSCSLEYEQVNFHLRVFLKIEANYSPIPQLILIEMPGWEFPYVWMHTVLHLQHVNRAARLLQSLKQASLKKQIPSPLRQHCGRQLLGIAYQHRSVQLLVSSLHREMLYDF